MTDHQQGGVGDPRDDTLGEAIERLEWADGKQEETPHSRMRAITRRTALTGGAAGVAAAILAACGGGGSAARRTRRRRPRRRAAGRRQRHLQGDRRSCKFVFVNHVTTNPFFVPTKYGAEDACTLLGC